MSEIVIVEPARRRPVAIPVAEPQPSPAEARLARIRGRLEARAQRRAEAAKRAAQQERQLREQQELEAGLARLAEERAEAEREAEESQRRVAAARAAAFAERARREEEAKREAELERLRQESIERAQAEAAAKRELAAAQMAEAEAKRQEERLQFEAQMAKIQAEQEAAKQAELKEQEAQRLAESARLEERARAAKALREAELEQRRLATVSAERERQRREREAIESDERSRLRLEEKRRERRAALEVRRSERAQRRQAAILERGVQVATTRPVYEDDEIATVRRAVTAAQALGTSEATDGLLVIEKAVVTTPLGVRDIESVAVIVNDALDKRQKRHSILKARLDAGLASETLETRLGAIDAAWELRDLTYLRGLAARWGLTDVPGALAELRSVLIAEAHRQDKARRTKEREARVFQVAQIDQMANALEQAYIGDSAEGLLQLATQLDVPADRPLVRSRRVARQQLYGELKQLLGYYRGKAPAPKPVLFAATAKPMPTPAQNAASRWQTLKLKRKMSRTVSRAVETAEPAEPEPPAAPAAPVAPPPVEPPTPEGQVFEKMQEQAASELEVANGLNDATMETRVLAESQAKAEEELLQAAGPPKPRAEISTYQEGDVVITAVSVNRRKAKAGPPGPAPAAPVSPAPTVSVVDPEPVIEAAEVVEEARPVAEVVDSPEMEEARDKFVKQMWGIDTFREWAVQLGLDVTEFVSETASGTLMYMYMGTLLGPVGAMLLTPLALRTARVGADFAAGVSTNAFYTMLEKLGLYTPDKTILETARTPEEELELMREAQKQAAQVWWKRGAQNMAHMAASGAVSALVTVAFTGVLDLGVAEKLFNLEAGGVRDWMTRAMSEVANNDWAQMKALQYVADMLGWRTLGGAIGQKIHEFLTEQTRLGKVGLSDKQKRIITEMMAREPTWIHTTMADIVAGLAKDTIDVAQVWALKNLVKPAVGEALKAAWDGGVKQTVEMAQGAFEAAFVRASHGLNAAADWMLTPYEQLGNTQDAVVAGARAGMAKAFGKRWDFLSDREKLEEAYKMTYDTSLDPELRSAAETFAAAQELDMAQRTQEEILHEDLNLKLRRMALEGDAMSDTEHEQLLRGIEDDRDTLAKLYASEIAEEERVGMTPSVTAQEQREAVFGEAMVQSEAARVKRRAQRAKRLQNLQQQEGRLKTLIDHDASKRDQALLDGLRRKIAAENAQHDIDTKALTDKVERKIRDIGRDWTEKNQEKAQNIVDEIQDALDESTKTGKPPKASKKLKDLTVEFVAPGWSAVSWLSSLVGGKVAEKAAVGLKAAPYVVSGGKEAGEVLGGAAADSLLAMLRQMDVTQVTMGDVTKALTSMTAQAAVTAFDSASFGYEFIRSTMMVHRVNEAMYELQNGDISEAMYHAEKAQNIGYILPSAADASNWLRSLMNLPEIPKVKMSEVIAQMTAVQLNPMQRARDPAENAAMIADRVLWGSDVPFAQRSQLRQWIQGGLAGGFRLGAKAFGQIE